MQTRSSVLGKRHAMAETTSPPATSPRDEAETKHLPTPASTPTSKRFKSSATIEDGDNNKENIPPLRVEAFRSPSTTRSGRSLRRTMSESMVPTRVRATPRRPTVSTTSRPATPTTAVVPIALATPPSTPPHALQPICARARALLRPTCNGPAPLSGRSNERDQIIAFIEPFLATSDETNEHAVLYISGSPGTGKTAMVTAVFDNMRTQLETAEVVTVVINCMALNSVDALWDRLKDEFQDAEVKTKKGTKAKKVKESSLDALKRLFASRSTKCILLLDELDHIASSTQALDSLFSMMYEHRSHLRLIGIANTHTLSSKSTTELSAHSNASVKTLHFAPYTASQLLEILQARLAPLFENEHPTSEKAAEFLSKSTLKLLTMKIAALTGDVRALFEVLRGAIDIAVNSTESANPLAEPTPPVKPEHVLSALKAYAPAATTSRPIAAFAPTTTTRKASDSEMVNKVRDLSLQARLVVLATLLARRRLDAHLPLSGSPVNTPTSTPRKKAQAASQVCASGAIDTTHLHTFYKTILARSGNGVFSPVSRSEFSDLLNMVETVGLFTLSSSSVPGSPSKSLRRAASFGALMGKTAGQEVHFIAGVRLDEVARGLGISDDAAPSPDSDVKEEEVRAIWGKEKVRISREGKALGSGDTSLEAFAELTED